MVLHKRDTDIISLFFHLFLVVHVCYGERTRGRVLPNKIKDQPKIHTLFSVECGPYFDWQTIGIMHSYRKSGQPGPITRLLSCTENELEVYPNMDIAPTFVVPSWTHNPRTGDWYPAINKPKGVLHWVENSPDAKDVDWVIILDADMIIRGPVTPWELKAEIGKPVAARYDYLIGCDNILGQLHMKDPSHCDKVGGFIVMHIEDLRKFAPLWLSKTEEVRADKAHYATNITGDVYGQGWISEMYGYSFGASDVNLRHKILDDFMIYPGYVPNDEDPHLLHYGLEFQVLDWNFGKSNHEKDPIVNECNKFFEAPPFPSQIIEKDRLKKKGLLLSIECINSINEGLLIHHAIHGCPEPPPTKYINFLKNSIAKLIPGPRARIANSPSFLKGQFPETSLDLAKRFLVTVPTGTTDATWQPPVGPFRLQVFPKPNSEGRRTIEAEFETETEDEPESDYYSETESPKLVTLFSVECNSYFDWQTLGLMYSWRKSGQPGAITRLLSCTDEDLQRYRGMNLAPTLKVPNWTRHPKTGDWYSAINKPLGVVHWLEHSQLAKEVEWVLILDADQVLRSPIVPWELGAGKGRPVSAQYNYLIGCDNILGQLHMKDSSHCDKVGGFILMHIEDLRKFAPLWLSKTEEVRADKAHYATNITGDVYGQGWISEMYGYSFGASDAGLYHKITNHVMLYPGYVPLYRSDPKVLHYGLPFNVGEWRFAKSDFHTEDLVFQCGAQFPPPPLPSVLPAGMPPLERRRDLLSLETVGVLNRALREFHLKALKCSPEGEPEPGGGDLGLGSEGWEGGQGEGEIKVLAEKGKFVEGANIVEEFRGRVGEEKGMFVVSEMKNGNGDKEKGQITGGLRGGTLEKLKNVGKSEKNEGGENEMDEGEVEGEERKRVEVGENDKVQIRDDDGTEEGGKSETLEERGDEIGAKVGEGEGGYIEDDEDTETLRKLSEDKEGGPWRSKFGIFKLSLMEAFLQGHPKFWIVLPWAVFLVVAFGALSSRKKGKSKSSNQGGSGGSGTPSQGDKSKGRAWKAVKLPFFPSVSLSLPVKGRRASPAKDPTV